MDKLLLGGGGGHCKVVIDAVRAAGRFQIAGIISLSGKAGHGILDIPIIGKDGDLGKLFASGIKHFFVAVGSLGDCSVRETIRNKAHEAGFTFPNVIHPEAWISPQASLGDGNYIGPGAIVAAGSRIGSQCIINTGAIVDHDCEIGDFVHLATGCALSGEVKVGVRSHLGTGACVRNGISIGQRTIVGVGSVVVSDMPSDMVCFGNPCRPARKNA